MRNNKIKNLGHVAPIAQTLIPVYTTPERYSTIVEQIIVCNRGDSTTFRIAIVEDGVPDALDQYISYDTPIAGHSTIMMDTSIYMTSGDIIRVYAGSANVTFQFFGNEDI